MLCACLLIPGCIVGSVQPLVDKEHIIYDNALLGRWTSKNCRPHLCFFCTDEHIGINFCTLEIIEKQFGDNRDGYLIILTDENGYKEEIEGKLIDLGGQRFLDTKLGYDSAMIAIVTVPVPYLIPVHIFWKISVGQDNLSIMPLDEEWLVKETRNMVTISEPDYDISDVILTAPRSQLQELLRKNANNPKAFSNTLLTDWTRAQNVKKESKQGEPELLRIKGNVERIKRFLDRMVEMMEQSEPVEEKK